MGKFTRNQYFLPALVSKNFTSYQCTFPLWMAPCQSFPLHSNVPRAKGIFYIFDSTIIQEGIANFTRTCALDRRCVCQLWTCPINGVSVNVVNARFQWFSVPSQKVPMVPGYIVKCCPGNRCFSLVALTVNHSGFLVCRKGAAMFTLHKTESTAVQTTSTSQNSAPCWGIITQVDECYFWGRQRVPIDLAS